MSNVFEIKVPDIGDFKDVPVIEIFVKVGDKVSEGNIIMALDTGDAGAAAAAPGAAAAVVAAAPAPAVTASAGAIGEAAFALAYAGPAVRKLVRELAVDLGRV